jgi:hypothetical protein
MTTAPRPRRTLEEIRAAAQVPAAPVIAAPAVKLAPASVTKHVKSKKMTPPPAKVRKRSTHGPGRGKKGPVDPETVPAKDRKKSYATGWMRKAIEEGHVDEYGLPIPPDGAGKRGPDIRPLLTTIMDRYTPNEIQDMLDEGSLPDGTRITCRISMRLREVLDAHSYDYRVRIQARKHIDDRLEGTPTQTVKLGGGLDNTNNNQSVVEFRVVDHANQVIKPGEPT